jgi:flagellum-specific ATP synthase
VRELLPLGAYVAGADPATDRAVQLYPRMEAFLKQGTTEAAPMAEVERQLLELMA